MALRPLIAICGTTGAGKSKLAVELALNLSQTSGLQSEVINADAMQVYFGLDILTNKVPVSERQGVPHLLMGFKRPGEQYVIGEWVQDAVKAIDQIHDEGKLPIVVGGTSYWMHHLLFPNSLPGETTLTKGQSAPFSPELSSRLSELPHELRLLFNDLPSIPPSATSEPDFAFKIHLLLFHLDPEMAKRWHWKDTRKVLRNLHIIYENGRLASEMILEAHKLRRPTRYNTLIFWPYCKPEVLNPRLDKRVDEMLNGGLLEEVSSLVPRFRESIKELRVPESEGFTNGIYQSIGFREFYKFLSESENENCTPEERDRLYNRAVEEMKHSTRKYAQRQVKWIRNKLLPAARADKIEFDKINTYVLDATDYETSWQTDVLDKAKEITSAFLSRSPLPDPCSLSALAKELLSISDKPVNPEDVLALRRKKVCPDCTVDPNRPVMIEEGREWDSHVRTRTHRKLASKRREGCIRENEHNERTEMP